MELQIVALAALIVFIVLSIFLMFSLTSATKFLNKATESLGRFDIDFNSGMRKLTEEASDMKVSFIISMNKTDSAIERIATKTEEITEIKNALTKSLRNVDEVANMAFQRSSELTEIKDKAAQTLDSLNGSLVVATVVLNNIDERSEVVANALKPAGAVIQALQFKVLKPIGQISTFIKAFNAGYYRVANYLQKRKS